MRKNMELEQCHVNVGVEAIFVFENLNIGKLWHNFFV